MDDEGSFQDSDSVEEHGFIDLEAEESGSSSDESRGIDSPDLHSPYNPYAHCGRDFHQFSRLPIEMRHRIWEMFCPDLTSPAAVFEVHVKWVHALRDEGEDDDEEASKCIVSDGVTLETQTSASRIVLAVNRESRAFALRRLPDTFTLFNFDYVFDIRFKRESDIVLLREDPNGSSDPHYLDSFFPDAKTNFFSSVRNVAVGEGDSNGGQNWTSEALMCTVREVENLGKVYRCYDSEDIKVRLKRWVVTEFSSQFLCQHVEMTEFGFCQDLPMLFCWPRAAEFEPMPKPATTRSLSGGHLRFSREHDDGVADHFAAKAGEVFRAGSQLLAWEDSISRWIWPMLYFVLPDGFYEYDYLLENRSASQLADPYQADSPSSPGEYESDGINDEEVSDNLSSAGTDDILAADGSSAQSAVDLTGVPSSEARFSSPEEVSGEGESEGEGVAVGSRAKRRRMILESDETDEEDRGSKRPRVKAPVAPLFVSDDEEDLRARPSRSRRARPTTGYSEEESESSDGDEVVGGPDSTDDDDSDEDGEDDGPKKMTLVERLGMGRGNPRGRLFIDDDNEEDSESGERSESQVSDEAGHDSDVESDGSRESVLDDEEADDSDEGGMY